MTPGFLCLFEYDCEGVGGTAGRAGRGGSGGSGGRAGFGGSGGSGGRGGNGGHLDKRKTPRTTKSGRSGSSGSHGSSGRSGQRGADGRSGSSASHGRDGKPSTLTIKVTGGTKEKGKDRYNLLCHGFMVSDENEDGIFEPGHSFTVHDVKFGNEGTMTLPSGSVFSLSGFKGGAKQLSPPIDNLGGLKPKSINGIVPGKVTCEIAGVPVSKNKPHVHVAMVTTSFTMLGRPFWDSCVTGHIRSMYPVRVVSYNPPEFLGPKKRA